VIEVSHLTRRYGSRCAVQDLSFSVPAGQIVGLLGPNGAGKSTTMNMLTGYLAPTDGTVRIEGCDILDQPLEARKKIGYLPEIPPLYADMKVNEQLNFVAQLRGIAKKDRAAEITAAAKQAGVEDVMDRLIGNLSKGYRQRVGLAAALIGHPPFLILDEPTVGLDPKQMIEMRALIRELGKSHTVLISSHILSEVSAVCDHVLILAGGKLVASGTPEELARAAAGHLCWQITVQGDEKDARIAVAKVDRRLEVQTKQTDDGLLLSITSPDDTDRRAALSCALVQARCPILAMAEQRMSLEDVFLQLIEPEDGQENEPDEAEQEEEAE